MTGNGLDQLSMLMTGGWFIIVMSYPHQAPCTIHLPTFAWFLGPMLVNIPAPWSIWPKDLLWLAKDQLWPWRERETPGTTFFGREKMQNYEQFAEKNPHKYVLQKLRNVSLCGFHCKLEKPMRRWDLKMNHKKMIPNHASTVPNRVQVKFNIELV